MTDRELLKMAAKAAGIPIRSCECGHHQYSDLRDVHGNDWDPLEIDGQALRLAAKLCIEVRPRRATVVAYQWSPTGEAGRGYSMEHYADHSEDPCAATRRAIVRAAAEIGRTL